jgi:Family of unknown function (DUF6527)
MRGTAVLQHVFVKSVPRDLEDGILYVSIDFATVMHKCACGCGNQVVTPLSPADWTLSFDGQSISLHPSIGNWSFACRSHYWIRKGRIVWAEQWSDAEIAANRRHDNAALETHHSSRTKAHKEVPAIAAPSPPAKPWWRRILDRVR